MSLLWVVYEGVVATTIQNTDDPWGTMLLSPWSGDTRKWVFDYWSQSTLFVVCLSLLPVRCFMHSSWEAYTVPALFVLFWVLTIPGLLGVLYCLWLTVHPTAYSSTLSFSRNHPLTALGLSQTAGRLLQNDYNWKIKTVYIVLIHSTSVIPFHPLLIPLKHLETTFRF